MKEKAIGEAVKHNYADEQGASRISLSKGDVEIGSMASKDPLISRERKKESHLPLSHVKDTDHESAKKVLLGELALMSCLLLVAVFNTLNAGVIVDAGPPPPFWIVLIANPVFCTYGLLKGKK